MNNNDQGSAAGGVHHNVEAGEEVQGNAAGGAHQNVGAGVGGGGGGGHQIGPVLRAVFGIMDAMAILNAASISIRVAAVNRIGQVTEVTTLVPALGDVMCSIEDSWHQIQLNSLYMFMEVYAAPQRVMYPQEIRTMELAARMVSSSVMRLQSLVHFNSNLRVDGHGPRFRIHRELAQLHFALSEMQRSFHLLFSLEPPGYVYEEE